MRDYEFRVRIHPAKLWTEILGNAQIFDSISDIVLAEFEGDVTPSFMQDTIILDCYVEGKTLEGAMRRVMETLRPVVGDPKPGSYPYGSHPGSAVEIELPYSQFALA